MSNVEYVTTRRTTVTTNRKGAASPATSQREKWRKEKQEQRARAKQAMSAASFTVSSSNVTGLWQFAGELPVEVVSEMLAIYNRHIK